MEQEHFQIAGPLQGKRAFCGSGLKIILIRSRSLRSPNITTAEDIPPPAPRPGFCVAGGPDLEEVDSITWALQDQASRKACGGPGSWDRCQKNKRKQHRRVGCFCWRVGVFISDTGNVPLSDIERAYEGHVLLRC